MILGIPIPIWLGVLGAILVMLYIVPSKKKEPEMSAEDLESYIGSLSDITEMRWIAVRVAVDKVTILLDRIEEAKITVMYQFFVREGEYDMFFRCRKSQLEELKKALDLE